MLDEEFLKRFAFFLVSFGNLNALIKTKKTGYDFLTAFNLPRKALANLGFSDKNINNIKKNYRKIAQTEFEKAEENNIKVVSLNSNYYPQLLKEIFQPPEFLYVRGDISVLNKKNKLAIVGSRRQNAYGKDVLNAIIPDICKAGIITVSGMAYGIDSTAHGITLLNSGKTIGVNAGGLLNLYPKGNSALFPKIQKNGCIISEFPLEVKPRPFFFPIRNRIISGISKSVLVVQATIRSGSLITARLATEQNRDVFTVPGDIYSSLSSGPHYLIKQGAKLIENSNDILEEFGIKPEEVKPLNINLSTKEKNLLDIIPDSSVKNIDYFVEKTKFNISDIISILMGLVLKGVVIETKEGYTRKFNG